MLIINARGSDWLSQPMGVPAFIEDLAESAFSIIYSEKTAVSNKSIGMNNDAMRSHLIGAQS